ncbi:hypothetical protein OS493_017378 [Desmophyllum pertusum]|uniref:Uncharacterized protein n=1 Tax=Desmophyllum pertusum TaxID=174260 RepID=A0A9X0A1D1_9CNID|nr:hypothetical protein OS493_017378 [Desmophyllum pertusum]
MVDSRVASFSRAVTRKGNGLETPNYGSSCKVKLKVFCQNGTVLQNCEKEVVIGEGDSEVSETLDKCLECMHVEDICVVSYPNSENLDQELGVASKRDLKCELELLSFSKAKEVWELLQRKKFPWPYIIKPKGQTVSSTKSPLSIWHPEGCGKWVCAARRYSQAVKQLILIGDEVPVEHKEDQDQLRASCLLNLSACQGKLGQYEFVAENCTKVLAMLPTNIKALYRRGQAFVVLNEFEKARTDLEKASALDPSNKAVQDQLRILKQKERQHNERLSRALGAMFGRKV